MSFHPLNIMIKSRHESLRKIGNYFAYLWKYRNMLFSMVKRDFKGKYRHSSLGYAWHVLIPLSLILVYYVIFNDIFGKELPNYWLYLSSAVFALNLFSTSMVGGTNAITSHTGMITKMSFPREMLIISHTSVCLINSVISYVLLIIIMAITNTSISINLIFIPIVLLLETCFAIGVGLLLGSINVYIRDIANGIHIIQMFLIFITPCFYVASTMSPLVQKIVSLNPVSYYTETMHNIMYYAIPPSTTYICICAIISVIFLIIGLITFKKLEKGFAERL